MRGCLGLGLEVSLVCFAGGTMEDPVLTFDYTFASEAEGGLEQTMT